jgi:hypothetical protein
MIGRVEVIEILGMAGTCAVLLFAGFSVETLVGNVQPSWAVTVDIKAPEVPVRLPDEIRLHLPDLEKPVHPAPPGISINGLVEPVARTNTCGCRHVIT